MFLLLCTTVGTVTLSCKKDSSPKDRRIQIDELLEYQIVEEYQPNTNAAQSAGTYQYFKLATSQKKETIYILKPLQCSPGTLRFTALH